MSDGRLLVSHERIDGSVHFHLDLHLTAKELTEWPADRLMQLFGGMADVMSAVEDRGEEESE